MAVYRGASIVGSPVSVATQIAWGDTLGPSVISTGDDRLGLSFAVRGNGASQDWEAADKGTRRLSIAGNWMCLELVEVSGLSGAEIGSVTHRKSGGSARTIIGVQV